MKKLSCVYLLSIAVAASIQSIEPAMAWGPHGRITEAALEVLPDLERWNDRLGKDNVDALVHYCLLPDLRGRDLGAFYADDYLLIRAMPYHAGHVMPGVQVTFEPYFHRALQALRTENPVNACRQLGPLVHFVEDVGAPPHAKEKCPHHTELENWVDAGQISIRGYQPRLLGRTDEEAIQGMLARIAEVVKFSTERADRALPLVSAESPDRAQVEPIILESALESARLTADVLHTVFTLGTAPQEEGASLSGTVTAAELPGNNDHGARIVLVGTDYCTLATTVAAPSAGAAWQGAYEFHHLPAGDYRVLAYRVGSQQAISEPVTLAKGRPAQLDFSLALTEPAGNLVDNPDSRVRSLQEDVPDHWKVGDTEAGRLWTASPIRTRPNQSYRCGAVLKDSRTKVRFELQGTPKKGETIEPTTAALAPGQASPAELHLTADDRRTTLVVYVEVPRDCAALGDAIERLWVVPAD